MERRWGGEGRQGGGRESQILEDPAQFLNNSCRFLAVNLKVEEILSTLNFHFHHFHFL